MRTVACAFVFFAVAACSGGGEATPVRAADARDTALLSPRALEIAGITTERARYEPWRDAWRVPARVVLDPLTTEPLGSIVEGRVLDVRVVPGDRVRKGDVLVAIHTHEMIDARSALAVARAQATSADSAAVAAANAAERGTRLLAAKAMAAGEVERLRATAVATASLRQEAHAELARADEFLAHLIGEGPIPAGTDEHAALIRAPFDGVVMSRDVQPGQVAVVGQHLVTVSHASALALILRLPEEAIGVARVGSVVRFTVAAYPDRVFDARVTRVAPVLDSLSRTLEVVAAVADPRNELKPELAAAADLLGGGGARALVVPAGAVQAMEGDTVVIVSTPQGDRGMLIEAVRVHVGRRTPELAEVLAGLDSTAVVVVKGAFVAKAELLKRRSAGEP